MQEKRLPKFYQGLGERRLDAALEISPDSRDAWLLKGWYFYNRDDAENAVGAVRKALGYDPENSKAWLALGFFLAKAGDSDGAACGLRRSNRSLSGLPEAGRRGRYPPAVDAGKIYRVRLEPGIKKGESFSK